MTKSEAPEQVNIASAIVMICIFSAIVAFVVFFAVQFPATKQLKLLALGDFSNGEVYEISNDFISATCWEDDCSGESLQAHYRFRPEGGKDRIEGALGVREPRADLPYGIEVQYLPSDPKVHRVVGVGPDTVGQWFIGNWFGVLLFVGICSFCIYPISKNARVVYKFPGNPLPIVFSLLKGFLGVVGFSIAMFAFLAAVMFCVFYLAGLIK